MGKITQVLPPRDERLLLKDFGVLGHLCQAILWETKKKKKVGERRKRRKKKEEERRKTKGLKRDL